MNLKCFTVFAVCFFCCVPVFAEDAGQSTSSESAPRQLASAITDNGVMERKRPIFEQILSEYDALLSEPVKVQRHVEALYDSNTDGLLQQDEILSLYQDVYYSLLRRKKFKIHTTVLDLFDRDENGKISGFEIKFIDRFLRSKDAK